MLGKHSSAWRAAALVGALAATGVVGVPGADAAPEAPDQAPPEGGDYIVTLPAGMGDIAATAATQLEGLGIDLDPGRVFESALDGYTVELTADQALQLEGLPGVAAVEPDGMAWLAETQPGAPWGLDRIDQADLPLSGDYTTNAAGTGVSAYVIDSGIRTSHADFEGRVAEGVDLVDGGAVEDCAGHGTHVASTIGGATYGVAKDVTLVPVRGFGCESRAEISRLIEAIDWVVADHDPGEPAVANMSFSYEPSEALDQAVQRLVDDGVTAVVAAGNGVPFIGVPLDACIMSPGRLPAAITVAASDSNDGLGSFSNRGSCVDIVAPGVGIVGAGITDDTATATMDGTSMAAPHVAGVAAQVLQQTPGAMPAQVTATLQQTAERDTLQGTGSCWFVIFCLYQQTPNLLLRNRP